jgi:hypothetical protein
MYFKKLFILYFLAPYKLVKEKGYRSDSYRDYL